MRQRSFFQHSYRFAGFLWQQLQRSQWRQSAAALTYTSLFALVPIMTVSYALLTFMPQLQTVQGKIEGLIFHHFLPSTGNQVNLYLQQFSQQARNLTVPGLLILIVTALLMLKTIENAFNAIWEVKRGRQGMASFLLYWAVLSLGPVLMGAALMLSTYLLSLSILSNVQQLSVVQQVLSYMPLLLSTAALCLMYSAVPNCAVPLKHALAGALITAIVFGLVKDLFALGVKYSSYTLIYGAFAAVPLFLTWVYLCWMIVLFGAVLVRSFSTYSARGNPQQDDVMLALLILHIFWRQHQAGKTVDPPCLLQHPEQPHIGLLQWERQREILLAQHIIEMTADGGFVLCRDLHQVSLWDIQQLFAQPVPAPQQTGTGTGAETPPWAQRAQDLLQQHAHMSRQHLCVSLADLFQVSPLQVSPPSP